MSTGEDAQDGVGSAPAIDREGGGPCSKLPYQEVEGKENAQRTGNNTLMSYRRGGGRKREEKGIPVQGIKSTRQRRPVD